jgi:hypothetical protein
MGIISLPPGSVPEEYEDDIDNAIRVSLWMVFINPDGSRDSYKTWWTSRVPFHRTGDGACKLSNVPSHDIALGQMDDFWFIKAYNKNWSVVCRYICHC